MVTKNISFVFSILLVVACGDDVDKKKGDETDDNNGIVISNGTGNNGRVNNGRNPGNNGVNSNPNNSTNANNVFNGGKGPFQNNLASALNQIHNITYDCRSEGDSLRLRMLAGNQATLDDYDGNLDTGTYEVQGSSVSVSFPNSNFIETTTNIVVELDIAAALSFPSLECGANVVNNQAIDQDKVTQLFCDNNEYIPNYLIEENRFTFSNTGFIYRRRWEKLLAANDELFSTRDGIWKEVDGVRYAVFPFVSANAEDDDRYLTFTGVSPDIRVKQFSHNAGFLCEWDNGG